MKPHALNGLHAGFGGFEPLDTGADVVILAGDIDVGMGAALG